MDSIEYFQTERLKAQRISGADFEFLDRMNRDPAVMATLGGPLSAEQTREFLDASLAHWDRHGYGIWILNDLASGEFAGRAGLRHIEIEGVAEVEVLYALMPEFWRAGLASEITDELIRIAFNRLGLPNVVAFTLPSNRASRRVMEKSGLMFERQIVHAGAPHVLYRVPRPQGVDS
ncbi:MAG TPA: GNAT family N-acetyltransferase [Candidatus Binataceae bacterium]|jgi:RimJ/RimL family protein N-acetyltransferase